MEFVEKRKATSERTLFVCIALIALGMRWWRLDLISFRYDTAEAAFRAIDVPRLLRNGIAPLTGIVNSHGFENAPGFIWLLAPPFAFSPDLRYGTAWHALLAVSGIYPLYKLARSLTPAKGWLLPCSLYAFSPAMITASRTIWAQNLLPALGAWTLYAMYVYLATNEGKIRGRAMVTIAALLLLSTSVHYSAGIWLILSSLVAVPLLRFVQRKYLIGCAVVIILGLVSFIPSLLDWNYRRHHPLPKPVHVVQFEGLMPEPDPIPFRIRQAYQGLFGQTSTNDASGGVQLDMPAPLVTGAAVAELIVLLSIFGGLALVVLQVRSNSGNRQILVFLLLWILLPPVLAAILVKRINGTYFAFALPAVLLVSAFVVTGETNKWRNRFVIGGALVIAITYGVFWVFFNRTLDISRFARGQYYIPLVEQEKAAKILADKGVAADAFFHISGGWFQRPYEYLLLNQYHGSQKNNDAVTYALMEDLYLRRTQPIRCQFLEAVLPVRVGNVAIGFYENREAALSTIETYRNLPGN